MKTLTQLTAAGALGVALLANNVCAQAPPDGKRPDGAPPGGGRPGGFRGGPGGPGGLDQVIRDLNLTDAQQGKVDAIQKAQQEKMKACNAKAKGLKGDEFKKTRNECLKAK